MPGSIRANSSGGIAMTSSWSVRPTIEPVVIRPWTATRLALDDLVGALDGAGFVDAVAQVADSEQGGLAFGAVLVAAIRSTRQYRLCMQREYPGVAWRF
jgi:hypothetical protein